MEATFKLYGYSNGAALTNRILIENSDARITHCATDGSQLNTHQYHDGSFYIGGTTNTYTTAKTSLTSRNVLQMVGGQDSVIPASGGQTVIGDGTASGKLVSVEWQASAYAFALAMG